MSQLLPSGWENSIPLIAALWLASIFLLVFSARRYFASRAHDRSGAELTPMQEPFIGASRTPGTLVAEREVVTEVDNTSPWVAAPHDLAAGVAATIARAPDTAAESVFEGVRARIARDGACAQGLSELIRALYLDQSNFTFHTIAELNVEDRALAKRLIEEWLADPSAVEPWEEIYDTVRESHLT